MLKKHEPVKSKTDVQYNGEDEDSSDHDLSAFFYPALQMADIFELEVDIAFGGMDQRKAHVHERGCRQEWVDKAYLHPYSNAFRIKGPGRQNGLL